MHFSHLSHDTIDHILTFLTDFCTLSAAIRVSKSCYAVFQACPKSIVNAIARNVAGPALPAALRLTRQVLDVYDDEVPDEARVLEVPMTRPEANCLCHCAQIVRELEDLFSWRYKDRMSRTSNLSSAESMRFSCAMYRFWLYCETFKRRLVDDSQYQDLGEHDFLMHFLSDQLSEMREVASFLSQLREWLLISYSSIRHVPNGHEIDDSYDPESILHGLKHHYFPELNRSGLDLFLDSFDAAAQHNNETASARKDKSILDTVIGEQDRCHRCQQVFGNNLWGPTNWSCLKGYLSALSMCNLLDGNLPRNFVEVSEIILCIHAMKPAEFDSEVMVEMFNLEEDPERVWSRNEWYCLSCVQELFRQRFRKWWIARKEKEGKPFQADCWYGYNCWTQYRTPYHARRLNHLCEPTRGTAPPPSPPNSVLNA
ncbi:hypothetical protein AcV7_000380 [Taiwanofungus camphoratus]|nr:hypothetical protein AcV7_000380 [Antrodia cinnamomea]